MIAPTLPAQARENARACSLIMNIRTWAAWAASAPPAAGLHLTGKSLLAYPLGVGDLFKALADETRRAILDELTERNGQTLFELCGRLVMKHGVSSTRQAISQHLDVLEAAGLVTTRRDGRYKFHDLDTAPLDAIAERWPAQKARENQ